MKTVIALSLAAACVVGCNDKKTKSEPVDTTRTTTAVIVEPTLHDGHAAEPNNTEQSGAEDQSVDKNQEMDVDEAEMSGTARDGGY